jgi:hypothetical protein
MRNQLRTLAFAAAVVCAATGAAYAIDVPDGMRGPDNTGPGIVLLTLSLLAAAALITAGFWQSNADDDHRGLPLAILAALGAGYVFANVVGLQVVGSHAPRVLSWVGLAAAVPLFVTTLAEIVKSQRARAPEQRAA